LKIVLDYLKYLLISRNLHGIHSPFVYQFVKEVIYSKKDDSSLFTEIEAIREKLKKDRSILINEDYGAGSLSIFKRKTIGQFAKSSSKSKKYAKLLYRLAKWHKPAYALELGTALGISSFYQSLAFGDNTHFISLEGNRQLVEITNKNKKALGLKHPEILVGNFNETLQMVLDNWPNLDWVFFDGNHQKEATLKYFEMCLEKASKTAIFIFDDINWSAEMQTAWEDIKQNNNVYLTVDLFFMGLVFLQKRPQKEHFVVRF
jgi:predicted O-methyltransferase YrrM